MSGGAEHSLQYPIGRFVAPGEPLPRSDRDAFLRQIEHAPGELRAAVTGLEEAQLDTPYRPGGWTVRQVVHHLPDSHLNSYVRFRLALTEEVPTIRPYDESAWARLPDSTAAPIELSLALLETLHRRWTYMLKAISETQWRRCFRHPDLGLMSLERTLALYAWHGRHHVAHVTSLRGRMRWF